MAHKLLVGLSGGARDAGTTGAGAAVNVPLMAQQKLTGYLDHEISLAQLVDWAESAMLNGEFADPDAEALRFVVSHLGLADFRAFGLTWEDCENLPRPRRSLRIDLEAYQVTPSGVAECQPTLFTFSDFGPLSAPYIELSRSTKSGVRSGVRSGPAFT